MPRNEYPGVDRLAGGFTFTEGPVWSRRDHALIFSDIPAARTLQWSAAGGLRVLREKNRKANGNAIDSAGRLLSCEHTSSRVVRWEPDGSCSVLASHFEGRELNSPNDVIVSRDGTVFFTDPPFGRVLADMGDVRARELEFAGVYSVTPNGSLRLLSARCAEPNGLCLSDDESRLLVNDTATGEIIEFSLTWGESGGGPSVDEGRVWAVLPGDDSGSVDGMKFDRDGNLYCTAPGGIQVLDAEARLVEVIRVPEKVGNFAWGDDDHLTLFICATTSLYATRRTIPGLSHDG